MIPKNSKNGSVGRRCDHQRSSGFVESFGSGGGSDSELNPVSPEIKTEVPSLKLRLVREEDADELSLRVDQNREHLRRWES